MSYLTGMRRQRLTNTISDLNEYKQHVVTLEAHIAKLEAKLKAANAEISSWSAHYAAEESRCVYAMEVADKLAGGAEKNPARQTHTANIQIESGSRKGQNATNADIVYFNRISGICKKEPQVFGDWRTLIRGRQIFE